MGASWRNVKLRRVPARARIGVATGVVLVVAFAAGAGVERVRAAVFSDPSPIEADFQPLPPPTVLLDERFSGSWPNRPDGTAWLGSDGYRLYARQPGHFVSVRSPLADVPPDVVVSGRLRKVGGPTGGGYGLIVADQHVGAGDGVDQEGEYVVAAVGDRGEFGIWRRDGSRWTDLQPWSPSSAVHAGAAANELAATVHAGQLTFTVNGQRVASVATNLNHGAVGVFAGGDANQVAVERFTVAAPRSAAPSGSSGSARAVPAQPATAQTRVDPPTGSPIAITQRIAGLLQSIFQDIGAIYASFANGPDSRNPVTDPSSLKEASDHLDSATGKAYDLAREMQSLQNSVPGRRGGS